MPDGSVELGEPRGPILRLTGMKALVLTGVVVLSLVGCTSSATSDSQSHATHPAAASGAATQASTSPVALSAAAVCARFVPGSGQAVRTTVAAVRQVKRFAFGRAAATDPAYRCSRLKPGSPHTAEWWATTEGGSTVLLARFASDSG
jgi:hypothetical protein